MQALARLGIKVDESMPLDILLGENFNGRLYGMTPVQMDRVRALREVLVSYNSLKSGNDDGVVSTSEDAVRVVYNQLKDLQHEEVWAAYLSRSNKVLEVGMVFKGALTEVTLSPRTVISKALCCNATAIILYHCHPSGNPNPSSADIKSTDTLRSACALMDILLLDHIIVTRGRYFSFADQEIHSL